MMAFAFEQIVLTHLRAQSSSFHVWIQSHKDQNGTKTRKKQQQQQQQLIVYIEQR